MGRPFEQVDELAELAAQAVMDARRICDLEEAAADDAVVITQLHAQVRSFRPVADWCPVPIADGGTFVRITEDCPCGDPTRHRLVYVKRAGMKPIIVKVKLDVTEFVAELRTFVDALDIALSAAEAAAQHDDNTEATRARIAEQVAV